MRTITYKALHQAFAEILVEYGPDHVYDREANHGTCVYVNAEGDPQCLVGVALVKLGVEPGYLYTKFRPSSLGLPWENYDIPEALTIAQISQDNGSTWGEAIDRFEKYFTVDKETY